MRNRHELPPPPQLNEAQVTMLQKVIEERLTQAETGRLERIKKIQRYRAMHQDDYSHRVEAGSIYEVSNIGVPLLKAVATSYAAKVEDELLSAEAPFQVKPREDDDKDKAELYGAYWNFEIMDQMGFAKSASEGIAVCCVEGTAIKKRSWRIDRSYFPAIKHALHDPNGNPMMDPDGEHIFEDHPVAEVEPTAVEKFFTAGMAKPRQHVMFGDEVGPELTENHTHEPITVKESITHYDGAESKVIPFEDFICSLNVDSINASPIVGHKYQNRLHEVMERVSETANGDTGEESVTAAGWIFANLVKLKDLPDADSSEGGQNTPGLNKPNTKLGESQSSGVGYLSNDKLHKKVNLIECYLKYDIDDDGTLEDIIVLIEAETKMPLWIVYLVSVYEDCKLPFDVIGFFQVPNRWYSMGPYEYLECAQDFVDRVFNRMNYRTSMSANPITWHKPENFVKPPKRFGPGERCQLRGTFNIEQSMGFITMPSMEGVEWQHFQFFISLIQLTTGVSNAAQGDVSSLPSTQTATGITSIINEGNKLYRMFIRRQQGAMEREIGGLVRLNQQNLNEEKVVRYFSNTQRSDVQGMVNPEDLREIEFDVKITLSKTGLEQKSNMIARAIQILQGWIQVPPQFQAMFRDLYVQLLQTIGIVDAERILPSVESIEEDQGQDQQLQQIIEQISAAAQKIEGAEMDPKKQVAGELMSVMEALQQMIAVPPELPKAPGEDLTEATEGNMFEKMGGTGVAPDGQGQPLAAEAIQR